MKKFLFLSALFLAFTLASRSQTSDSAYQQNDLRTLFGENREGGWYGAFTTGYTTLEGQPAVLFGGRVEYIANHSIGIGFGGSGFMNEYHYDPVIGRNVFLTGGYGGFYFEPILFPRFPVHVSFPVLLGAGGVSYATQDMNYYHDNLMANSHVFLVAEPAAEIELNITRHIRISFGASYRITSPFDVGTTGGPQISSGVLDTWSYLMTFKFGKF